MSAPDDDPRPDASGSVPVDVDEAVPQAADEAPDRSTRQRRMRNTIGNAVGDAVGAVGDAVGAVGGVASRLGDATHRVPLVGAPVGAGISKLGEGMEAVGESLSEIPKLRKTKQGRMLIRSMLVGFLLVSAWIVGIVALQVHTTATKDFRPEAVKILGELSAAQFDRLYDEASPRFQEITRKDRFIDDMTDLRGTVGRFREIAAVNDTLVTNGPSGKVGRVSLAIAFDKATCKTSISFHYSEAEDTWKLLGFGVELPTELKISQHEREERIAACRDPMNAKTCDVHADAVAILDAIDAGRAGDVWDRASAIMKQQLERARFVDVQEQHRASLGKFRRVIAISEAKVIGGTSATFDVLCEYEKSSGVRAVFGFQRETRTASWQLRSFKVVVPVPRAADVVRAGAGSGAAPKKR